MKLFKNEHEPELFAKLDFAKFVQDPLGKDKAISPQKQEAERLQKFNKNMAFNKIKEQGFGVNVDTTELEKVLRGEDDQALREKLQEIKDEKKGHQFKPLQKFDVEKMNLQVIKEQETEDFGDITGSELSISRNDLRGDLTTKNKKTTQKNSNASVPKNSKSRQLNSDITDLKLSSALLYNTPLNTSSNHNQNQGFSS